MHLLVREVHHQHPQADEQDLLQAGAEVHATVQARDQVGHRDIDEARGGEGERVGQQVQRGGQRPYRLVESPRFRMAYDFLALRAASGEVSAELEAWWRTFQHADADTRKAMLLPDTGPRKKRRRRRRRRDGAGEGPPPA